MESIVGWICATIMVLCVATCAGMVTINSNDNHYARVERCETAGKTWSSNPFNAGCIE